MAEKSHSHNESVDIWAVGILAFELMSGRPPFSPTQKVNNYKYVESVTKQNILTYNYIFPEDFSELAKNFIQKILVPKDVRATLL
jgi:serine/threonine protein kinase